MKQTLSNLDLREKPGQRVTYFRHVRHYQEDGPVDPPPGARVFSAGAHHSFYTYVVEFEEQPAPADGSQ
jgi:hypothetical protein